MALKTCAGGRLPAGERAGLDEQGALVVVGPSQGPVVAGRLVAQYQDGHGQITVGGTLEAHEAATPTGCQVW
jgi:hypothetical protein